MPVTATPDHDTNADRTGQGPLVAPCSRRPTRGRTVCGCGRGRWRGGNPFPKTFTCRAARRHSNPTRQPGTQARAEASEIVYRMNRWSGKWPIRRLLGPLAWACHAGRHQTGQTVTSRGARSVTKRCNRRARAPSANGSNGDARPVTKRLKRRRAPPGSPSSCVRTGRFRNVSDNRDRCLHRALHPRTISLTTWRARSRRPER
jgi:hypothetical protein